MVKCATEVARLHKVLYKVVHKVGRLREFNRAREIEFNFFTVWTFMKLGTLVHHVYGYKTLPQFFLIFAQGLSYGLSKSKNGVKSSLNLKIIIKSLGKKSEAIFVDLPFFFHSAKTVCVYRK